MSSISKHLFVVLCAMVFLVGALAGCGAPGGKDAGDGRAAQGKAELIPINLGCIQTTGSVLYFVALEEGFFKDEGLDASLHFFTNAGEGINALIAGKLDIGAFGTAPPLNFIARGQDIVMFGGHAGEGHAVVAMPEKAAGLKTLKDYRGKNVATVRMATGDIVWRYGLKNAGIDWRKDLTIKELESPSAVLEAVRSGSVDAGVIWSPYRTMAEDRGMKIVLQSGQVPGMEGHTCCRQITMKGYMEKNPDIALKFMRAIIRAYDFFKTNKEKTMEDIAKYIQIDMRVIEIETYGPYINDSPEPNAKAISHFWDAMREIGYIESDIDIKDHINVDVFKKALDELIREYPGNTNYQELQAQFEQNRL